MSITIRDILSLNGTAHFTLVAGEEGLFRAVEMADMLESGWERTAPIVYFEQNSFVLSSFTFAQNDPLKIKQTIYGLINCGVAGLAYKPYFFFDLPEDALRLAEDNHFPILRIDNPDAAAYRNIILDITNAIQSDKNVHEKECYFTTLAIGGLSREEVATSVRHISTSFLRYGKVVLISNVKGNALSLNITVPYFYEIRESGCRGALCRFNGHIVLIMTSEEKNDKVINGVIYRVLQSLEYQKSDLVLAHSNIHSTYTEMDVCMRESIDAYIAALILDKRDLRYAEIGTLSFLIPLANNAYAQAYQENFFQEFSSNEEYMKTAVEFVRAECNYEEAAKRLQYHKNTVRYRITKMWNAVAPNMPLHLFFQNLTIAVYIQLASKYLLVKNRLLVDGLYTDTSGKSGR